MIQVSSAGKETAVFQLIIQNKASEIVRLSQWLNQTVAPDLQLSDKLTFRLDLILEESLTNVIDYAFDSKILEPITVIVHANKETVSIQVIDEGRPFNPLTDHEVQLPNSLDEAGQGGLGLHLIRSYTQTCQYQRSGNQNIFTMILDRHPT